MDVAVQVRHKFLSTPSARRATGELRFVLPSYWYFYPRPPRGGRPLQNPPDPAGFRISIHALREEGDGRLRVGLGSPCNFYPRPPRGGRHYRTEWTCKACGISIHALREEGDDAVPDAPKGHRRISIHALREEGDPHTS